MLVLVVVLILAVFESRAGVADDAGEAGDAGWACGRCRLGKREMPSGDMKLAGDLRGCWLPDVGLIKRSVLHGMTIVGNHQNRIDFPKREKLPMVIWGLGDHQNWWFSF